MKSSIYVPVLGFLLHLWEDQILNSTVILMKPKLMENLNPSDQIWTQSYELPPIMTCIEKSKGESQYYCCRISLSSSTTKKL